MMRWRPLLLMVLCAVACKGAAAQGTFGIAPVYDSSGSRWGRTFAQSLTLYLFEDLQSAGVPAVLLNPGGVYSPSDTSWLRDYLSDHPGVQSSLVTTLVPSAYTDKNQNRVKISATAFVMDRNGQTKGEEMKVSTEIRWRDTDLDSSFVDPHAGWKFGLTTGRRTFGESPLGKAAQTLAQQLRDRLSSSYAGPAEAQATKGGSACPTHVKVTYSYKRGAASQAYTLIVNGLDQSMNIESGVASFKSSPGPMLVQMSVADAPYKLAAQDLYQFSTVHTCGTDTYVIDLGKSGDAHDHWE